jgi:hypothetical protein
MRNAYRHQGFERVPAQRHHRAARTTIRTSRGSRVPWCR